MNHRAMEMKFVCLVSLLGVLFRTVHIKCLCYNVYQYYYLITELNQLTFEV